jgi:TolA-binding protein
LRTALSALRAGQHDRAAQLLRSHATRFPAGQLARERLGIRIELLCSTDAQAARAALQRYARRYPGDSTLEGLRGKCTEAGVF